MLIFSGKNWVGQKLWSGTYIVKSCPIRLILETMYFTRIDKIDTFSKSYRSIKQCKLKIHMKWDQMNAKRGLREFYSLKNNIHAYLKPQFSCGSLSVTDSSKWIIILTKIMVHSNSPYSTLFSFNSHFFGKGHCGYKEYWQSQIHFES